MRELKRRLAAAGHHIKEGNITVMILGLGSVGTYLLDYLVSRNDPAVHIVAAGRSRRKMEQSVNIVRIAGLIRQVNRSWIDIEAGVDLEDADTVAGAIKKWNPDFIVNSSRAYPGLKYGSISWENVRAYGIWTPLAVKFTRNIMEACERADTDAVVINTSYSDAVIPWLKSAGKPYPDFGSGNLNHLAPRIRYAAAEMLGTADYWNAEAVLAAGHFHDVCISSEGHDEGVRLPVKVYYKGVEKELDYSEILRLCKIPMPSDARRNMMNASSNYAIIDTIIKTARTGNKHRMFIPGAFGNIGGYPVMAGFREGYLDAWIDESIFSFREMHEACKKSMYLDGIEDIRGGTLYYTDELIQKVKNAFGTTIPKSVRFDDIEMAAQYLIDRIIVPQSGKEIKNG